MHGLDKNSADMSRMSDGRIDTLIEWKFGGSKAYVIISTIQKQTHKKYRLNEDSNGNFSLKLKLVPGLYYLYFKIDGNVKFSIDYPQIQDKQGKKVNLLEV